MIFQGVFDAAPRFLKVIAIVEPAIGIADKIRHQSFYLSLIVQKTDIQRTEPGRIDKESIIGKVKELSMSRRVLSSPRASTDFTRLRLPLSAGDGM